MTESVLCVLLQGEQMGEVTRDRRGRLSFEYDAAWRSAERAIPLSLSMPLAARRHRHEVIEAFMWGLLPDNEQVLERWAKRFQVSARSAFALLSQVGEDCAGAVQFATPARLERWEHEGGGEVAWLSEHDVAERLRALRADQAASRMARDTGQFSLAGAQAKTALLFHDGRWGVPSGRIPTTHILKPPIVGLDGHVENEHLCLVLARELGLPTATSHVRTFEDQIAIVVERYDRVPMVGPASAKGNEGPTLRRVHQEDFCQALAVLPSRKYQNEGGPSPAALANMLRTHSSRAREDLGVFLDALIFNWLIAETDAHAKNYSLLLAARGQVRLAPLYDLGSALPYPDLDARRLKLAMKLGDTYRVREVGHRQLERLAAVLALDAPATLQRAQELITRLLQCVPGVCEREKQAGLAHPLVDRLAVELVAHLKRCELALQKPV